MMTLAVQIIAILFMLTMMFIAIWGFIIANQSYSQIKYQNYLLEKIAENISLIGSRTKTISTNNFDNTKLDCETDLSNNINDLSDSSNM